MLRSSLMDVAPLLRPSRQRLSLFSGVDRLPAFRYKSVASTSTIIPVIWCKCIHRSAVYNSQPDASSTTGVRSPANELRLIREMLEALERTNSKLEKEEILHRFDPLKNLLLFLFDRRVRMHVRPKTLENYLARVDLTAAAAAAATTTEDTFDVSLLDVFQQLSDRRRTGNEALRFLADYLNVHGILAAAKEQHVKVTLLDVFLRCLDRNLKVGVKDHIVRSAYKSTSQSSSFSVALGKPIEEDEVESLFTAAAQEDDDPQKDWFVSRKLDGVRCIVCIDLVESQSVASGWKVVEMQTLSRTGRPFVTLQNLTDPLKVHVEQSEAIKALLLRAERLGQILSPSTSSSKNDTSRTARLYFDGEVCKLAAAAPPSINDRDEVTNGVLSFVEDFQGIVGPIKRKNFTVAKPAYFPFDILTFSEFHHWRTMSADKHDPFHVRLLRVEQFVRGCPREDESVVRHLEQKRVHSLDDVREWMLRAAKDGWEGLILRQGGPYEGKRTSSIRKLKHFYEDEYVVQDVELAQMRLPVGQKYAQRTALASAVILHKGTPVHVGSGFNVEQRIRFARRPELLIGKQITVAYFGESHSAARTGTEEVSLRFPRVKAIWEDGIRDV